MQRRMGFSFAAKGWNLRCSRAKHGENCAERQSRPIPPALIIRGRPAGLARAGADFLAILDAAGLCLFGPKIVASPTAMGNNECQTRAIPACFPPQESGHEEAGCCPS